MESTWQEMLQAAWRDFLKYVHKPIPEQFRARLAAAVSSTPHVFLELSYCPPPEKLQFVRQQVFWLICFPWFSWGWLEFKGFVQRLLTFAFQNWAAKVDCVASWAIGRGDQALLKEVNEERACNPNPEDFLLF